MTKKTTSDELKTFLAQISNSEEDWKRLSKKKNDEGQWVRRFENKKTHVQIDITEISAGKFIMQPVSLTAAANESFAPEQPPIDVTQDVLDELLRYGSYPDMPQEQAEKTLKDLYRFALLTDEWQGGPPLVFLEAVPGIGYDESYGVASILKGLSEVMDCTYTVTDPAVGKTPVAIATYMKEQGIAWDKALQERVGPDFTKELESWDKKPAAPAKKNSRPKP